jgi:predicted acetyltransferase
VTITLAPIRPHELPALRNLWELYVHDFTEFVARDPHGDGRFETDESFAARIAAPLELLWIRRDAQTVGFVFIRPCSYLNSDPTVSDIAQFFVLRGHRRAGVGRAAAALAFARRPGPWEVREIDSNLPAQQFWRRAVGDLTGGRFAERAWGKDGARGVVQVFQLAEGSLPVTPLT